MYLKIYVYLNLKNVLPEVYEYSFVDLGDRSMEN